MEHPGYIHMGADNFYVNDEFKSHDLRLVVSIGG